MYPSVCLTAYTRVYLCTRSYRHRMYARVCVAAYAGTQKRTVSVCVCVCVCIDASMHTHPCVSCPKAGGPGGGGTFASRVCLFAPTRPSSLDGWNAANVSFPRRHGWALLRTAKTEPLLLRRLPVSQHSVRRSAAAAEPEPLRPYWPCQYHNQ